MIKNEIMNIPNDCHNCETATELLEAIVVRNGVAF